MNAAAAHRPATGRRRPTPAPGGAAGGQAAAHPVAGLRALPRRPAAADRARHGADRRLSGRARRASRATASRAASARRRARARPAMTPGRTSGLWDRAAQAVDAIGDEQVPGRARRARAPKVAGMLMKQVKFPTFVAGLIQGVFQSIVKSSIEQMEAYSKMIASVAKSLHQFTDDNVTENQGRDHMVDQFPDLFEIGTDEFGDSRDRG